MTRHAENRHPIEHVFGHNGGCAPAVRKHQPGRLAPSTDYHSEEVPVTTIADERRPVQTEARYTPTEASEIIAHLQELLAAAIADRASLVERNIVLHARSKHWFVGDDNWASCLACNLPENNTRHCERVK